MGSAEAVALLAEVRACRLCAPHLPHGPRPVVQIGVRARILLISQAPGPRAHRSGLPFDDLTGDTLRGWLGVDRTTFYDPGCFGILPIGFCYPGRGHDGDLPPRPECAPLWHARLLALMPEIRLVLLLGSHAQKRYLPEARASTLTGTVCRYREFLPSRFPLPHPSPRNRPWFARHPWFDQDVVPALRSEIERGLTT
ncbi:MAG: uracil-DNA glycosylase family protein [Geminicoccaceae bacterium]